MKLTSSKPQPQPISTTEQGHNKRSRKRSAFDWPDDQQNSDTLNTKESLNNKGRNKKICSPSSYPPPPSPTRRERGRQQADNNWREFDRGAKSSSTRQLWSPSGGGPQRPSQLKTQTLKPTQYKMEEPDPEPVPDADVGADDYTEDPSVSQLIRQPETRPISQEQLVAEVKGIYAGLVMVESKCIEVDNGHLPQQLNNEQWQGLIALHRTLLHEHHDFFMACQHPSASPALRRLASKYNMSARMRSHNILNQLTQKLLNRRIYQEYPLADSVDKQYYVAGTVNGMLIEALPDTGADKCFISSKLASRLGLLPVPGTQEKITLANEKVVESPGMVQVPWEFTRQREKHMMNCWILPGCIRDLVLGSSFLQATNTLKRFRDRIKVRLIGVFNRFSLSFLGGKKQRLRGYINGHLTAALPDTGSDAMFVNGAFARKIGLDIDSDVRNLVEVELADGSTTMTSGIVRDVQWRVGKTTVQCTFHVLEDLCMDVILSNSYLFNMNIFSEQEEHFFDMDSKDHFDDYSSYFCSLRLLKNKNVASPKAFSPEMTQHELEQLEKWEKMEELYRRDESRDWIMGLPEEQQEKAVQDEKARQQCWEASRKERKAKLAATSHTAKENVRNDTDLISRLKKRFRIGTPLRK
ncbi:hypothetical protein M431DRAFT_272536 [Trichoderma harzianum CBS 226.95]|uniref:Uncharacterized protein n=1 Tax=Trichoderma harzianum CBS 226.95 TaxID=983964 RepID=A0A2T3ZX33_TRIHA|nr:hypothetical protein M431DRAFT_272536 [Trichoderma harzianum CBS 226.95]PTB49370.1 hypothetical protein M431DRAFT_272536 [Trichoderma harzianum CBS 226.95]